MCLFLPSLLTNTLLMNIKMQLSSQKLCITYLHKLRIWCFWRKFALLWHLTQNTRSEKGEVRYGLCMFCLYFRHLVCPFSRHFVLFQAILCYLNKNVKLRIITQQLWWYMLFIKAATVSLSVSFSFTSQKHSSNEY